MISRFMFVAVLLLTLAGTLPAETPLKIGVFDVDAFPPVGSPLAYNPTTEVLIPLSCRGVVLIPDDKPIVLCAVDWIGIGNDGQMRFCEALAQAAGTSRERVAVHTLHQHDAPRCDFTADLLLAQYGINQHVYDVTFNRQVIDRAAKALKQAVTEAEPVTHIGLGEAAVEKVASNRRILGPDGKVKHVRWTTDRNTDRNFDFQPAYQEEPLIQGVRVCKGGRGRLCTHAPPGHFLRW